MADSELRDIPVDLIIPNPQQPRKEFDQDALQSLADSIAEHGVIQPIEVEATIDEKYMLHHGERRWRASKLAGRETIPAVIVEKTDDDTRLVRALVENIQREDMNPIELARAYQVMRDRGLSLTQIARQTGKAHATIKNHLLWLTMEEPIQKLVADGKLHRDHHVRQAIKSVPREMRVQFAQRCVGMTIDGVVQAADVIKENLDSRPGPDPNSKNGPSGTCDDKDPKPGRAHCLTLVVGNCEVPGPFGDQIEQVAQETCEACPLFEYDPGPSCHGCPAKVMVAGFVDRAEMEVGDG